MTPRFTRCVFVLLLATQLCACALLRPHPKKAQRQPEAKPFFVGTITVVNEDGRFVLIDSGASPGPMPGAVLKSRTSAGESGELKVGEIRRRPFAIADVVKGTPRVGDQVFQQPSEAPR